MHHLDTFDDWLKYQQIDRQALPEDVEVILHGGYERARSAFKAHDVHSVVRRPRPAGEHRYAIAIEDGANLWLTFWVKRSPEGECFILYPRGRGTWNPHASYHSDGRYHQKSYDQKFGAQQRQPLDQFKGTEHLGMFGGHGTGTAICDPASFTAVLRVPTGILEAMHGCVLVDLVEPGMAPAAHHRNVPGLQIVHEETYRDCLPWVVVAIASQTPI
jgi:hypothetical protein